MLSGQCGLPSEPHGDVDPGIHLLDARENGVHHLQGRDLSRAEQPDRVTCGREEAIAATHRGSLQVSPRWPSRNSAGKYLLRLYAIADGSCTVMPSALAAASSLTSEQRKTGERALVTSKRES